MILAARMGALRGGRCLVAVWVLYAGETPDVVMLRQDRPRAFGWTITKYKFVYLRLCRSRVLETVSSATRIAHAAPQLFQPGDSMRPSR